MDKNDNKADNNVVAINANPSKNANSEQKVPKKGRKNDVDPNFVAPDGGWGWVVAIAAGISVVVTYPVLRQFGIIFRRKFENLGISSSEMTTIISAQQATALCSGLINGPLFRNFSLRQVSLIGNILVFSGLLYAAFANSFLSYFISISILFGIGKGIMASSVTIAVNTYFKEKSQMATNCQYAINSVFNIAMPHIATFLVGYYGVTGTVLLFSGVSLNNLACSATFQPVNWHMKKEKKPKSTEPTDIKNIESGVGRKDDNTKDKRKLSRKESIISAIEENRSKLRSIFKKIIEIFDLSLLKDFGYVNIAVGLTFMNIINGSYNFFTPFILHDLGLDKNQIADAMSIEAAGSCAGHVLIALTVEKVKRENTTWLIWGCCGMILGRFILMYTGGIYSVVLVCFAWMGIWWPVLVGFSVFVLPSHIPVERLPAALGLQRVIMGISNLAFGPFIGLIRDLTNFTTLVSIMNLTMGIVAISWLSESIYRKRKKKNPTLEVTIKN